MPHVADTGSREKEIGDESDPLLTVSTECHHQLSIISNDGENGVVCEGNGSEVVSSSARNNETSYDNDSVQKDGCDQLQSINHIKHQKEECINELKNENENSTPAERNKKTSTAASIVKSLKVKGPSVSFRFTDNKDHSSKGQKKNEDNLGIIFTGIILMFMGMLELLQ